MNALRTVVRLASLLVVGLVVLIYVGEGGFNPFRLTGSEAALMTLFWIAIAGLVVTWWSESLGGALTVGGMLCYYLAHRWIAGTWPAGWAFRLIALTGALVLIVACFAPSSPKSTRTLKESPS